VFLNWALGFRALGCEVTWLMDVHSPEERRRSCLQLRERLDPLALENVFGFASSMEERATKKSNEHGDRDWGDLPS